MHSDTNTSCQLGDHGIHTWAGYRHWRDESVWLHEGKRKPEAAGRLSPPAVKLGSRWGEPPHLPPPVQRRRAWAEDRREARFARVLVQWCSRGQVAPHPRAARSDEAFVS